MEKILVPTTMEQCEDAFGVIRSFQSSEWQPDSYHRALSAVNGLESALNSGAECSPKYLCKRMINLWFTYMDWKESYPDKEDLAKSAKDIVLFFYEFYNFSDLEITDESIVSDKQVLEILTRAKKES